MLENKIEIFDIIGFSIKENLYYKIDDVGEVKKGKIVRDEF